MNAQIQITHKEKRHSTRKARLIVLLAIALGVHSGQSTAADNEPDSYDENMLFSPSEAVLVAERKGRVMI